MARMTVDGADLRTMLRIATAPGDADDCGPLPGPVLAALAAGVAMLAGALWFGTPLLLAIVCFLVLMTAQGLIGPNGGALASAEVPGHPGTGSAMLGFVQWIAAGTVAPIAGLGGEHTAVPMALLMIACTALSMAGLLVLARPAAAAKR